MRHAALLAVLLTPSILAAHPHDDVIRRVALGSFVVQRVERNAAAAIQGRALATLVHALGESPFTVTRMSEDPKFLADRPWCGQDRCDLEFARASGSLVAVSAELVDGPAGFEGTLRAYDAANGSLLSTRAFRGLSVDDAGASAAEAARRLVADLVEMDRDATARMWEAPRGTASKVIGAKVQRAQATMPTRSGGEPGFSWKGATASSLASVPLVAASTLTVAALWPLLLVPGVNLLLLGAWALHPVVATVVAWGAGSYVMGRRTPLLPAVAASLVAEGLVLVPFVPLLLIPVVQVPVMVALTPLLAGAQAAATNIALHSTGRARVTDDSALALDLVSVPPAPATDGFGAGSPMAPVVADCPTLPRPYRLRSRPLEPPASAAPAAVPVSSPVTLPPPAPAEATIIRIIETPASDNPDAPADGSPLVAEPQPLPEVARPAPALSVEAQGGPDSGAVSRTLEAAMPGFNACYERALKANGRLAGTLDVAFTVSAQGHVTRVVVEKDTLGEPSVASCVVDAFSHLEFPPTSDGTEIDGSFPLSFVPAGE